jgi:glucosamine 6-phosphate synthetase-like amidotransferase/phosphosugar isomerase protein
VLKIIILKGGAIKMCGIGGVILIDKNRTKREIQEIRKITKRLLLELENRGSDSSGITVINKNHVKVFKQPIEAKQFVNMKLFNDMLERITNNTKGILLHTRAVTQGSKENNLNNHPIVAGDIIGVHNGIIYNDDEIFQNFRQHFKRQAEVDSEAIFRLINHYLKRDSFRDIRSIKKALKKLRGSMAIAFIDRFNIGSFYLYTNSNFTPITLAYIPKLRIFVFASNKRYIKHSTKRGKRKKAYCFYYNFMENDLLKITTNTAEFKKYKAKTKQLDFEKYRWAKRENSGTLDYYVYLHDRGYLSDYELELLKEDNEFEGLETAVSDKKEKQLNLSGMFC